MIRSADVRFRVFGPKAEEPEPVATAAPTRLERLHRAEQELQRAIEECRSALVEVRREISWAEAATAPVVH
jgi:hypothetical protein